MVEECGWAINDKSICELVEAIFGMSFQSRTTGKFFLFKVKCNLDRFIHPCESLKLAHQWLIDLLRKCAERVLRKIILIVFGRLNSLLETKETITNEEKERFGYASIIELLRVLVSLLESKQRYSCLKTRY